MNIFTPPLRYLLFGLLWCTVVVGYGQNSSPRFLCVDNDSLYWQPPVSPCGPFEAYQIFVAEQINGPYQLLTTITDVNQTSYYHAQSNQRTWHYYIQGNYNCPGQTIAPSDTLDNMVPLAGPITYVTVTPAGVELAWTRSPSPETTGYVIYRNTSSGTAIIDTVDGASNLTYTDTNVDAGQAAQTYFVAAMDRCGVLSLIESPHSTVHLTLMPPQGCDPAVKLSWTNYMGWTPTRYELFAGPAGNMKMVGLTSGGQVDLSYSGGNDGETICFYVEAIYRDDLPRSRSNEVCVTLDIQQPVRDIHLLTASVEPTDNSVVLEWAWDPAALVRDVTIERSPGGTSFGAVSLHPFTPPLSATAMATDTTGIMAVPNPIYRVRVLDECGNRVLSNTVTAIFLVGKAERSGLNRLAWTPYRNELATDILYELVRKTASGERVIHTSDTTVALTYDDDVDFSDPTSVDACYYVRARVTLMMPDGEVLTREARSNDFRIEQFAGMYVPNAVAPTGVNQTFRPYLAFGAPAEYLLEVYNRWGSKIFESQSIDQGWDGTYNGEPLPSGAYVYRLQLTQSDGTTITKSGVVNLLR